MKYFQEYESVENLTTRFFNYASFPKLHGLSIMKNNRGITLTAVASSSSSSSYHAASSDFPILSHHSS